MVYVSRAAALSTILRLLAIGMVALLLAHPGIAHADMLLLRSLELSNGTVGTASTYRLQFSIPSSQTLGSIRVLFCANDPIISDPCTVPGGLDVSSATLLAQAGATGFTIASSGTNAHTLLLSRVPAAATSGVSSYTLGGVINPSSAGTYYGRIQTYATADASGMENDDGGVAFSILSTIQVSATVPPYLLFCSGVTITGFDCANTSGDYLKLGTLRSVATASAQSQLLAGTNAALGYTIWANGPTMTSGNNVIDAMSVPDVSRPGLSQFGINLVANDTPLVGVDPVGTGDASPLGGYNLSDFYKFVPGDAIASAPTNDNLRKFTVSYIVNVQRAQPVGIYATTLTYACLANF